MILKFNLIIIFIIIIYLLNSYYLSIKQNIIKLSSFLLRILISWILANSLARLFLNINISSANYEFIINGEVIDNIVDLFKVIIIKNIPEFSYIINERLKALKLIENISVMLIRTIILILSYLIITCIYKIVMLIIKKIKKKQQKNVESISKKNGLIFGFIQGFIIIFLISIPLSGISSLTNDILRLEENKELSKDVLFIKDYRNTITGKVFNFLNIKNKPLDVFMFDEVFSVEVDDNTILISEEVRVYVDIFELIEDKNIKLEAQNLQSKLNEKAINELIFKLDEAKSLNISIPLLIDYFLIKQHNINLSDGLYDVNYYNESKVLGDLIILYLTKYEKFEFDNLINVDQSLLFEFLSKLEQVELLDVLSEDISKYLLNNEEVNKILILEELEGINLDRINYKKEIGIAREITASIASLETKIYDEEIVKLSRLIASSDLLMDNNELFAQWIIKNYLDDYKNEINKVKINEQDIRSLITIAKAYIDNGFLEPYFRISKLYDEATINVLIDAIVDSNLLLNNLNVIFKLFLIDTGLVFDFKIEIPKSIEFKSEEGKKELRDLLRLFQIFNYGLTQENLSEHLDEICFILENSIVIRENINSFLRWSIEKYNTTEYDIHIIDIDFKSEAGNKEVKSLINILRLLVQKKLIQKNPLEILNLTKDEIDLILTSKIIEEALIHFLVDLGKYEDIPIIVNFEVDDPAWYKQERSSGELRNLIYAIKIIFKDIKSIEDIKFTEELILSIDDGTIDTNGDGIVDSRDENELLEIMKSKIMSDTIIKFIYDYYKEQNK
ncbi:MAG: hypothetical protein WC006_09420 [Bacilli bacterium]